MKTLVANVKNGEETLMRVLAVVRKKGFPLQKVTMEQQGCNAQLVMEFNAECISQQIICQLEKLVNVNTINIA